jgi:hypothetical protein
MGDEQSEAEDRKAWDVLAAMRRPFVDVSPEEIEEATNRILAELREEDRQKRIRSPVNDPNAP